jgi:hypothetical protein
LSACCVHSRLEVIASFDGWKWAVKINEWGVC